MKVKVLKIFERLIEGKRIAINNSLACTNMSSYYDGESISVVICGTGSIILKLDIN
ncbi:hypothetical protein A3Q56_03814 [Intoshia linei]|uniref:Uncharacterized protein n=1 Tax=Intoshia linei TaxID=1819745 RepID=A0A177B2U6_9BILA|nr:hypothetical protein A3Q56_03814 [Intoshia linei]